MKKLLIILCAGFLFIACSNDFTDPNDPKFNDIVDNPNIGGGSANADVTLLVDATDGVDINPEIFGINNDWRRVPQTTFPAFYDMLQDVNYELVRFPGGWESEFYNWDNNTTPNWDNKPNLPGASMDDVKGKTSKYSIVIPTVDAMNRAIGSAQWNNAMDALKVTAEKAIVKSNIDEGIVEIGNEWWLQYAGGSNRDQKLSKYVNIAMNLAEFINTKFPNRKFKLLVNGDYTEPQEFTIMKNRFTKAYDQIDGVALHTYVGYQSSTHNMADLEKRIKDCANNFNPDKNYVYLSEWMPSRDYNDRAVYMEAANIIPDIIQIYARAGADAGAYWPPVNTPVPGLGITNWNYSLIYPVGQIFADLSKDYKGKSLKTTSNSFHLAAALKDQETMILYITGGKEQGKKVAVKVNGFEITKIESVEKFVPDDYADTGKAAAYKVESAQAEISSDNEVYFEINKEGKYQIYKITLKNN